MLKKKANQKKVSLPPRQIVYVAGPYRAKSVFGILRNIWRARRVSIKLWQLRLPNICPHMNSALIDYNNVPDDLILPAYVDIMKKCTAVFVLPNYYYSSGTMEEIKQARIANIPVFYSWEDLISHMSDKTSKKV